MELACHSCMGKSVVLSEMRPMPVPFRLIDVSVMDQSQSSASSYQTINIEERIAILTSLLVKYVQLKYRFLAV